MTSTSSAPQLGLYLNVLANAPGCVFRFHVHTIVRITRASVVSSESREGSLREIRARPCKEGRISFPLTTIGNRRPLYHHVQPLQRDVGKLSARKSGDTRDRLSGENAGRIRGRLTFAARMWVAWENAIFWLDALCAMADVSVALSSPLDHKWKMRHSYELCSATG